MAHGKSYIKLKQEGTGTTRSKISVFSSGKATFFPFLSVKEHNPKCICQETGESAFGNCIKVNDSPQLCLYHYK